MKKSMVVIAVVVVATFLMAQINFQKEKEKVKAQEVIDTETRGVFISYIEFQEHFQDKTESEIKSEIDQMIEVAKKYHLNRIYLQVRPFSDSIYPSSIFPYSHTVSGKQGESIDFDILDYFIKKSHSEKIELHAWINPYRISNYTDTSFLSQDNPAYLWLNTNHVKVIEGKGIYYNPASKEVMDLIVKGVEEIVQNYEIDGVLLDDYFYPDDSIDLKDYEPVKNTISITDFRLSNVNELVSRIYQTVKKKDSTILFGISPDGNIQNNYELHYADVKKWLKEDGYLDYIMPQLYYGFLHQTKPFIQTINEWKELIHNHAKLMVALSLYKIGEIDQYAKSGKTEWVDYHDIIKKQIQVSRKIPNYDGYVLFRYQYLVNQDQNVNLQTEFDNYNKLFQ